MRFVIALFLINLLACAESKTTVSRSLEKAVESLACPEMKTRLFEVYQNEILNSEINLESFNFSLKANSVSSGNEKVDLAVTRYLQTLSQFLSSYKLRSEKIEALAQLEFGSRSTLHLVNWQKEIYKLDTELQRAIAKSGLSCSGTSPSKVGSGINLKTLSFSETAKRVVFGSRLSLATSYQSCKVLRDNPLENDTQPVVGIREYGNYDSVGKLREIYDLPALVATHPYFQNESYSGTCKNVQLNPLIYDYGGRPLASTGEIQQFDLFQNQPGYRTEALGIDCSAFVFVGLTTAGLRLKKGVEPLARQVYGITSRDLSDPQNNGLTCLNIAKFGNIENGDLNSGDIIAVPGHAFFIESVGNDPLGIESAAGQGTCSEITSDNFSFVVSQSNPSKNAIGLHRMNAADYMREPEGRGKIKLGFEDIAKRACLALQGGKVIVAKATNELVVVRHSGTSECLSRKRVSLKGESCASACM